MFSRVKPRLKIFLSAVRDKKTFFNITEWTFYCGSLVCVIFIFRRLLMDTFYCFFRVVKIELINPNWGEVPF